MTAIDSVSIAILTISVPHIDMQIEDAVSPGKGANNKSLALPSGSADVDDSAGRGGGDVARRERAHQQEKQAAASQPDTR